MPKVKDINIKKLGTIKQDFLKDLKKASQRIEKSKPSPKSS